ncbi:MAG: electron transfer flavoprotein subunit beta/FixA family protein [Acidobacteria bacterium]|nr:electron transfer flavoprotein subunit beta/FixA family protein [Acidobacteriota bacterium]
MKIAVCIKQVPDSEARLRVAADRRWIDEEDLRFVVNESDEYALEEALQIAEHTDGEVVVFSLGPERVREALRKCLALGASRAVHLADEAFAGGDAIATGRALAAAIQNGGFDLVVTGSQSDDVGFGATGSILAGHLDWPHAWRVMTGSRCSPFTPTEEWRQRGDSVRSIGRRPTGCQWSKRSAICLE